MSNLFSNFRANKIFQFLTKLMVTTRNSGVMLTQKGYDRITKAIRLVEENEKEGSKLTPQDIEARISLLSEINSKGKLEQLHLGPKPIKSILKRNSARKKSIEMLFEAFDLTLEESDFCLPKKPILEPFGKPTIWNEINKYWLEPPDVPVFYGRQQELNTLENFINEERCRLVAIYGYSCIGKTALAIKLAESVHLQFTHRIWLSAREKPRVEKILTDTIETLSNKKDKDIPESLNELISRFIYYLNKTRCLLVIDNIESVIQRDFNVGQCLPEHQGYSRLFSRLVEARHNSCVILTSRIVPQEIASFEGNRELVKTYQLKGVYHQDSHEFRRAEGLIDRDSQWEKIVNYFDGNPRILKFVVAKIKDSFDSDISAFSAQGLGFYVDIRKLHSQQFEQLSDSQKSLAFWLAIKREFVSVPELAGDYILEGASLDRKMEVINESLMTLDRCSFIERKSGKFTLQNGILEYVTKEFVAQVCQEINSGEFQLLRQHFLVKATGKEYIRESQVRLILKPISEAIIESNLTLDSHLECLRDDFSLSYLAGNLINLLCHEKKIISGYDFSSLYIRQAYFRGKALHKVKLANSHLRQCVFNQAIGNILSLALSPDDKYLAIGDDENKIFVVSINSGEVVKRFDSHQDWIRSLSFNCEGNLLISGSSDSKPRIWDIKSEECIDVIEDDLSRIRIAVFGKTSNLIAYAGKDNRVDIAEQTSKISKYHKIGHFPGHCGGVRSVVFSPDDKLIASGGNDCTAKVWNVSNFELVSTFDEHTRWVNSVCFSHDGRLLATGSDDHTVKIWNLATEELVRTFDEHRDEVRSVAFHPNDLLIASAGGDKTIRIWDLETGECVRILEGHRNGINKISFCSNGTHLVSGADDQTVKIWNLDLGRCEREVSGYSNWVESVEFSPDNETIAISSFDKNIYLWDVSTNQQVKILKGHKNRVRAGHFNSNGKYFASCSDDFTVKIWDTVRGKVHQALPKHNGHTAKVRAIKFSPNDKLIASSGNDSTVRLWDVKTMKCVKVLEDHKAWVRALDFSIDGKYLASGSDDKTIKIWNMETAENIDLIGHIDSINSVAFQGNSQMLASAADDHTIIIWNLETNTNIVLDGEEQHQSRSIESVCFSTDGLYLISCAYDKTIKLWNTTDFKLEDTLVGHQSRVRDIAISIDSKILASCSEDGVVKVWDLDQKKEKFEISIPKIYHHLNINNVKGLSNAQISSLASLGAVDFAE